MKTRNAGNKRKKHAWFKLDSKKIDFTNRFDIIMIID